MKTTLADKELKSKEDVPLGASTHIREKTDLFVYDNKAFIRSSLLRYGKTAEGKSWSKWENQLSVIASVREHSYGKALYFYKADKGRIRDYSGLMFDLLRGMEDYVPAFKAAVDDLCVRQGIDPYAYPLFKAGYIGDNAYHSDFGRYMKYPKTSAFPIFIKKNYGVYRKDLAKAVASTLQFDRDGHFTSASLILKRYFPVDYVVKFLNTVADPATGSTSFSVIARDLRPLELLLEIIPEKHRKRFFNIILKEFVENGHMGGYYAGDAHRMLRIIGEYNALDSVNFKVASIKELHDVATRVYKRLVHKVYEIADTKEAQEIRGIRDILGGNLDNLPEGIEIISPRDTTEVNKWGDSMEHCIGSYAKTAALGNVLLFGITDHGKLIGNFSVRRMNPESTGLSGYTFTQIGDFIARDWKLEQIFGKYNTLLPVEIVLPIATGLSMLGVDIKGAYGLRRED